MPLINMEQPEECSACLQNSPRDGTKSNPADESGWIFGRSVFGIAAFTYLLLCLSVLRHSAFWLLGYVADDAFYYLQIARHLAMNGHSTFDGNNPTNGYHPGWMLLMTICAWFVPDRVALFKTSLAVEFGFQLATALLLIPVMCRFAGSLWGWLAGALWLLNPLPFTLALFGVEAPFAQFTVVLAVWVYVVRLSPCLRLGVDFYPSRSNLVLFGLSLALAFYGRTDQILLAATGLALLLGLIWKWTSAGRRLRTAARGMVWAGGAFTVGVLPWYLFSYISCGTLTQDSGAMKMLWHVRTIPGWNIHTLAIVPIKFLGLAWLATPFSGLLTGVFPDTIVPTVIFLLLLGLAIGALWAFSRRSSADVELLPEERYGLGQVTMWLGATGILSGLTYGLLIDDLQYWHLSIPGITLFLLIGAWGARLARMRWTPKLQQQLGAGLCAVALFVCLWHRDHMRPPYPWQRDVYLSEARFEALIPHVARIGSFDAGIPAYFSSRTVINLDGLVNHTAVRYWKTGTLDSFVSDQNIDYIANEPGMVEIAQKYTSSPIRLSPIATYPLRGWKGVGRVLWKVEK